VRLSFGLSTTVRKGRGVRRKRKVAVSVYSAGAFGGRFVCKKKKRKNVRKGRINAQDRGGKENFSVNRWVMGKRRNIKKDGDRRRNGLSGGCKARRVCEGGQKTSPLNLEGEE